MRFSINYCGLTGEEDEDYLSSYWIVRDGGGVRTPSLWESFHGFFSKHSVFLLKKLILYLLTFEELIMYFSIFQKICLAPSLPYFFSLRHITSYSYEEKIELTYEVSCSIAGAFIIHLISPCMITRTT
jgi:hypothetical protein